MRLASCFALEMWQHPRRCRIRLLVRSIWPQGAHLRGKNGMRETDEREKESIKSWRHRGGVPERWDTLHRKQKRSVSSCRVLWPLRNPCAAALTTVPSLHRSRALSDFSRVSLNVRNTEIARPRLDWNEPNHDFKSTAEKWLMKHKGGDEQ